MHCRRCDCGIFAIFIVTSIPKASIYLSRWKLATISVQILRLVALTIKSDYYSHIRFINNRITVWMQLFTVIKSILSNRIFQVSLSLLLLLLLLRMVDLDGFVEAVTNADPLYLIAAAALMTINRILMPIKWNLLLRSHHLMLGWGESIRIYYISTFFGLFLPATVGADSLRAIYTKQ